MLYRLGLFIRWRDVDNMKKSRLFLVIVVIVAVAALLPPVRTWAIQEAKRLIVFIGWQPDGSVITPTNQTLRPVGTEITFGGRPMDVALSPDGKTLAVLNFRSLTLIDLEKKEVKQNIPVAGGHPFAGILWDGDTIYTSQIRGVIQPYQVDEKGAAKAGKEVRLPSERGSVSPLPAGMAVSHDRTLYVVLNRENALSACHLDEVRKTQAEEGAGESPFSLRIPVGVAPYTVAVSNDGKKVYVSNWGGRRAREGDVTANSAGTPAVVDPETGVASTGTVTVLSAGGVKPSQEIKVGLHPCAMVAHPTAPLLFVANANSDTVSVIHTDTDEVIHTIVVKPDKRLPFGSAPNALAISPDGKRLYVANGGNNCVAVFVLGSIHVSARNSVSAFTFQDMRLLGLIPTGWYPGALRLTPDGKTLIVANVKGRGALNPSPTRKGHNSHDHLGSVSIIPVPTDEQLKELTKRVYENNKWNEVLNAQRPRWLPPFKHVVYIIKENRTYDQVLGDLGRGNGDPNLCQFGREVTPNHHALAEQFVTLDNFYCSGVLSADGHQWTNEAYVVDYLEKFFGQFARSYPYNGTDPLAYASSGFLWDNALKHGKTFRDYGEFVLTSFEPANATWKDIYADWKNGTQKVKFINRTEVAPLSRWMCQQFPGFTGRVPDQVRADIFLKEFREFERNGNFPNLVMMLLPDDHTVGTSPGSPTPRATVADNDLALGRIVEAISKSRFWKDTVIFVVEDDAQGGADHVDGHRTVAFCISPYTRRGAVDSTLYNQTSIVRTIELILGLPPMNQFDLTATPMYECFGAEKDLSPYIALPNKIPLDELNPPLRALRGKALYFAQQSLKQNFTYPDAADEDMLNRIIWHSVKGYDVRFPEEFTCDADED
jgi:YVTN family beta-propeller protein